MSAPRIHPTAYVHPAAVLLGDVEIGPEASVWPGASLRGDMGPIRIGEGSSVQDCVVMHNDPGQETVVGRNVSVGHGAIVHGATVEDDVIVGMNAVVLGGAVVGSGSVIGAGAVVTGGTAVPPESLVLGVPGKVVKRDPAMRAANRANADRYRSVIQRHKAGQFGRAP